MATAAERLAAWGLGLRYAEIPGEVVEAAKLHFLDTIGCGLAAHALNVATEGRTMMAEQAGTPDATVIGLDRALPGASAAFANAMLCHGLDFDDTHPGSVAHVSAVVTPAALAAAEVAGVDGRELITAVVLGNETVCRIGMATPSEFHHRGFHPTSICGIFGGTLATGRLWRTAPDALTSALGIAGPFASGTSSSSWVTSARAGRRLASPTSRTRPATTSTARSARPAACSASSPSRRSRTSSSRCPRPASLSSPSRRTPSARRAPTTRRSSACSTRPRRCSCTGRSA